jgi:hypothetical protein
MDSIKLNLKFWLAGLIAGVILVERWRRYGARHIPDGVPGDAATSDTPKASKKILAGAKADAKRVKDLLASDSTGEPVQASQG